MVRGSDGASLSRKWIESAPRGISFRLGNLAEVGPPGSFGISVPDRERGRAESLVARGDDRLSSSWIQEARRELVALCGHSAAWGYRRGHRPSVEPTALACLGLLASVPGDVSAVDLETTQKAADWMQAIQRSDGSLPVSEGSTSPGWATAYGLMLWGKITGKEEARRRARAWLLDNKGVRLELSNQTDRKVGHDTSLVGWPWVTGTHSWLEPTALAILALRRDGLYNHPRITAGIELILDRALDAGGWNYGNKSVFGTELRPQPGPTGLALLALASSGVESRPVSAALAYLRQTLRDLGAPVSLGWGILGLRAHHACPMDAEEWLARSYARCVGKADSAMGLALLLLASSERTLDLVITPA
jgi:hypothetical protein